jgi:hypothetical protein
MASRSSKRQRGGEPVVAAEEEPAVQAAPEKRSVRKRKESALVVASRAAGFMPAARSVPAVRTTTTTTDDDDIGEEILKELNNRHSAELHSLSSVILQLEQELAQELESVPGTPVRALNERERGRVELCGRGPWGPDLAAGGILCHGGIRHRRRRRG